MSLKSKASHSAYSLKEDSKKTNNYSSYLFNEKGFNDLQKAIEKFNKENKNGISHLNQKKDSKK